MVDDQERTPEQRASDFLAMLAAVGCLLLLAAPVLAIIGTFRAADWVLGRGRPGS